ncbi:MAG: hypothetical protein GPJ54_10645 [Candidatus Heimdallarchaeota archaeon]|nr:hypothetical protein [Candidatus Heimdallarchaeota archaeon]
MNGFKLIDFIVEEENSTVRTGDNLLLLSSLLLLFGLCVSLSFVFIIRKNKYELLDMEDLINPVYRIQILLMLRYFIAMMDYVVLLISDEKYSLNDVYEYTIWPLFLIQFWRLISNKDLIQISRQRVYRFDLLYRIMIISILLSIPFIILSNFVISNVFLELITFIPLLIFSFFIYRMVKIESEVVISKINKIRLEHLKDTWKYIIIHFLAWAIGNPILSVLSDERTTYSLIYITQAIIMNLSPIFVALSIYWALFIPNRSRDRHNIASPKDFTTD